MRYWKQRPTPGMPRVGIAIASYLRDDRRQLAALRCLLASLEAQTYPHWRAVVVHDGPLGSERPDWLRSGRFEFRETPVRAGQFGHPHRQPAAASLADCPIVGFSNGDNYYAPVFLEALVHEIAARKADLAYCDMVHSHQLWKPVTTKPTRGKIDVGGFLVRRSLVEQTPWTDYTFSGDGRYVEALVRKCRRVAKVPGCLFVHN